MSVYPVPSDALDPFGLGFVVPRLSAAFFRMTHLVNLCVKSVVKVAFTIRQLSCTLALTLPPKSLMTLRWRHL
jgi:hypothetical protein